MMRKTVLATAAVFLAGLYAQSAYAIPALARKYNLPCSECHSAVPYLNSFGRQFKESGYSSDPKDYTEDVKISEDLIVGKTFPLSLRIKSKLLEIPDDGTGSSDVNFLSAIHEVELLYAGRLGKGFSAFGEFEYEDEDGFNAPGFGNGVVTYHHNRSLNVQIGWAPLFFADPYNSLSDMRRISLLRHTQLMNWQSSQSNVTDERLRKSVQQFNVNGRLGEKVFYLASIAAPRTFDGETNRTGGRPQTLTARVVFDVLPALSIGGFYIDGEEGDATDETLSDFQRYGFTIDGETKHFVYRGAYTQFDEQDRSTPGAPSVTNDVSYFTLTWLASMKNGHAFIVPEVTYNDYEDALLTGMVETDRSWTDLSFSLNVYVRENVRLAAEYWTQIDTPDGVPEQDTFLLGADFAF